MKRKGILNQEHEDKLLIILNSIEKRLMVCFAFLMILLFMAQTLLYYNVGDGFLNSVYKMEENLFSKQDKSIYNILRVYGEIPESEDVWILKNGIKINRITAETPVYIYIFAGDVIEIDATRLSGVPREIFFENMTSSAMPDNFPEKLVLVNKFYRIPAFYSN